MKDTEKSKGGAYPFILAWGRLMGSNRHYVDEQVTLAQAEKAPHDAVHRKYSDSRPSKWVTYSEIENTMAPDTKWVMENILGTIRGTGIESPNSLFT